MKYSLRWRFKFGIEKSKCIVIGKCPLQKEPQWWLGNNTLCTVDKLEILGNMFNREGNNSRHVDNRITKSRQSFYALGTAGMLYTGATPEVQAYLYKCICQPTLVYGLECMSQSNVQMNRLESAQGKIIKQCHQRFMLL